MCAVDNFGIPATVVAVEYLGADTIVTSRAAIGDHRIARRRAARPGVGRRGPHRVAAGQRALFDRASGKRRASLPPRAARGDTETIIATDNEGDDR